ncbi:hypothetical protein [Avibacterium paragallinarum]
MPSEHFSDGIGNSVKHTALLNQSHKSAVVLKRIFVNKKCQSVDTPIRAV